MSEAPKKIWIWEKYAPVFVTDHSYHDDIPYIRADIVDELVEALDDVLFEIYGEVEGPIFDRAKAILTKWRDV